MSEPYHLPPRREAKYLRDGAESGGLPSITVPEPPPGGGLPPRLGRDAVEENQRNPASERDLEAQRRDPGVVGIARVAATRAADPLEVGLDRHAAAEVEAVEDLDRGLAAAATGGAPSARPGVAMRRGERGAARDRSKERPCASGMGRGDLVLSRGSCPEALSRGPVPRAYPEALWANRRIFRDRDDDFGSR